MVFHRHPSRNISLCVAMGMTARAHTRRSVDMRRAAWVRGHTGARRTGLPWQNCLTQVGRPLGDPLGDVEGARRPLVDEVLLYLRVDARNEVEGHLHVTRTSVGAAQAACAWRGLHTSASCVVS